MKKRRRARPKTVHGEDVLCDVESITITLENGKKQKFNIASELAVSDDVDELYRQASTAHSRYAFWAYQSERALTRLRVAEAEHATCCGKMRYGYGRRLKDEDQFTSALTIEGAVDSDPKVISQKNRLIELRSDWTILRSVADALDHRTHLLRRLIAKDQDARRSE